MYELQLCYKQHYLGMARRITSCWDNDGRGDIKTELSLKDFCSYIDRGDVKALEKRIG